MTIGYNAAKDLDRPLAPRARYLRVHLDSFDAGKLVSAAKERDMAPNRLAIMLLRVILHDNLIDAVLDDDNTGESGPAARAAGAGGSAGVAI